jgi:hypothetical protein
MSFTQTMGVRTSDEGALRDHVAGWPSERPETNTWAAKLREIVTRPPEFRDFRLVCTTEEG